VAWQSVGETSYASRDQDAFFLVWLIAVLQSTRAEGLLVSDRVATIAQVVRSNDIIWEKGAIVKDKPLIGKVALVTGASRRVGYGAAIGLGEAGATVYMTGRTLKEGQGPTPFRGALETTAKEVEALGGKAIPIQCDHSDDRQVGAVFEQIDREQGRIDLLLNNAWVATQRCWSLSTLTEQIRFRLIPPIQAPLNHTAIGMIHSGSKP
jgi:hypothetical protein